MNAFEDDFARGSLNPAPGGKTYNTITGPGHSIVSGKVQTLGTAASVTTVDTGVADGIITCVVRTGYDYDMGLVFRQSGANYWCLRLVRNPQGVLMGEELQYPTVYLVNQNGDGPAPDADRVLPWKVFYTWHERAHSHYPAATTYNDDQEIELRVALDGNRCACYGNGRLLFSGNLDNTGGPRNGTGVGFRTEERNLDYDATGSIEIEWSGHEANTITYGAPPAHGKYSALKVTQPKPYVSFTTTSPAYTLYPVTVDASATLYATSYTFDFGDGTIVTQSSPVATHTYASRGTRTVVVTATGPGGSAKGYQLLRVVTAPTTLVSPDLSDSLTTSGAARFVTAARSS